METEQKQTGTLASEEYNAKDVTGEILEVHILVNPFFHGYLDRKLIVM